MTMPAPAKVQLIGKLAEDEPAEHDHPDDLRIDEGRQHRRRRQPMRQDQQPVAEAAEDAGGEHDQPGQPRLAGVVQNQGSSGSTASVPATPE